MMPIEQPASRSPNAQPANQALRLADGQFENIDGWIGALAGEAGPVAVQERGGVALCELFASASRVAALRIGGTSMTLRTRTPRRGGRADARFR